MPDYILIDTPVSFYNSEAEIVAWIDELKTNYPQDNEQVKAAMIEANNLLNRKREG